MTEPVRGLVLLASVLLWLPFLDPVVTGAMSVEGGVLRYAGALLLAWAGGAGLTSLVRGYARTARTDAEPGKRRTDAST